MYDTSNTIEECVAVSSMLHDDTAYLSSLLGYWRAAGPLFCVISRVPWHDQPGDWKAAAEAARAAGAEVVLGDWPSELAHRRAAQEYLLEQGITHALIPDGDEVIEPQLLQALIHIAENELADRVYVEWDTYWKSPEYVIRPRERFTPCILIDLRRVTPVGGRNYEGGRPLFLSAEHGIIHHLSYVGPDERIRRKITTWGHANEVVPGWWENVWKRWDEDKTLRNLHPTHPQAYGFAERIRMPEILQPAMARYQDLAGAEAERPAIEVPIEAPAAWPSVSVVIPLHGGADDLTRCLASLAACQDLLHEVIVVDNASPDEAADIAAGYDFVRLLCNDENRGFAAACNQGLEASTGEVVLFLNSDTVVPRVGLIRLIEALQRSGSIAAAGPYTNHAGHGQQIAPTYTSLETLDLFAEDFACRPAEDVETDMLVGFCLAVKRSVLEEVGGFDERFGIGTFEDNDLCYRMRRAGYRLVLAAKSFVHHEGSKTLRRVWTNIHALLAANQQRYREKWREDLESGFASHLSGLAPEGAGRIVFRPDRHPDLRRKQVAQLARRADISLCMIVKNEERVLGAALESAKPFFSEMIVVDTGSTDRTVEIAKEAGAKVVSFPWTDSFAEARNESLKHAKGRWVFWMDADDTLPFASGKAILQAALNAPTEVTAFIVPVQFVDDGTEAGGNASGTRVDHVKLFRNLPGLAFEGRIHEQILPSLRRARPTGQVARCGAMVLHSGYDTSSEGQAKKRERDYGLLKLDLEERPEHPFVLFNFGMTDHYCGEHASAVEWFERCIARSTSDESHLRKAYVLMAVSQRELGQVDESRATLEKGLEVLGDDPDLHFHLAHLLTGQGQLAEAIEHYRKTLDCQVADHFSSLDIGILGFKSQHNLAGLYQALGRYREAKEWWLKAIASAPQFLPSAFELFNATLEAEDFATARQMLEHVRGAQGQSESWAAMGARYAEAVAGGDTRASMAGPAAGPPPSPQDAVPLTPAAEEFLRRALSQDARAIGPRLVLARRLLHSGREGEAAEHLNTLNSQGVAEAAYFLGVMATRRCELERALLWMERARELNPNHAATLEQIANLRRAIAELQAEARGEPSTDARPDMPNTVDDRFGELHIAVQPETEGEAVVDVHAEESMPPRAIPFEAALAQVTAHFGLNADELRAYAEEDDIGGYARLRVSPADEDADGTRAGSVDAHRHWPGGSVWEDEGRLLYALVRALKPNVLVEVGSLVGCSTSHLAAACARNGQGTVFAVDPAADFSCVRPDLLPYIVPVREDVFSWEPPLKVDFLFEDGAHTPGFTRRVLERLNPALTPRAAVLCHDFHTAGIGAHVSAEFTEVMDGLGKRVGSVLIQPSDCGLGYAS